MPSEITAPLLGSISNGLSLAFNTQLFRAEPVSRRFSMQAASTGPAEVYPSLDTMRGIREWLGPRQVQQLGTHSFTIRNKKFEHTIGVKREDIEDDRFGLYTPIAAEMGRNGQEFPDKLIADLMKAGNTTAGYDGQNFFDTAHPNFDSAGAALNLPNYVSGSSPGWFLVDNTRVLKPFVMQTRVPFNLVQRFNLEDPNVFDNDEFLWGTRGRMNAGYGLWQLAYYSKAAFTVANLEAGYAAMAAIRRPNGDPMGIKPTTVIVPTVLLTQAKSYFENGLIANDPTTPTVLIENRIRGMFEPIEFPWLN